MPDIVWIGLCIFGLYMVLEPTRTDDSKNKCYFKAPPPPLPQSNLNISMPKCKPPRFDNSDLIILLSQTHEIVKHRKVRQEIIICKNCSAPKQKYSKCEYCGSGEYLPEMPKCQSDWE